ncbi:hypothetical protein BDR22DRAFT_597127 [Usnea florida]
MTMGMKHGRSYPSHRDMKDRFVLPHCPVSNALRGAHNPPLSVTKYNINTSISKVTVESIDAARVLVLTAGTRRRVGGSNGVLNKWLPRHLQRLLSSVPCRDCYHTTRRLSSRCYAGRADRSPDADILALATILVPVLLSAPTCGVCCYQ